MRLDQVKGQSIAGTVVELVSPIFFAVLQTKLFFVWLFGVVSVKMMMMTELMPLTMALTIHRQTASNLLQMLMSSELQMLLLFVALLMALTTALTTILTIQQAMRNLPLMLM